MAEMRVEFAAASLNGTDWESKIETAQTICARLGWEFGIQIHNTTSAQNLRRLSGTGLPLSFHVPILGDYFPNLAAADARPAFISFKQTVAAINSPMRSYQHGDSESEVSTSQSKIQNLKSKIAVFHGFLMTDNPIFSFNDSRGYDEAIAPAQRPELSVPGLNLCRKFYDSREFYERLERVRIRLAGLRRLYPQITWCIENDYPCYSAGLLLAEHAAYVHAPVCLDVSHLWISSLLYGRDFHAEVEKMAAAGGLALVHFHVNPIPPDAPLDQFRDGHRKLSTPNSMGLPRVARTLYASGLRHWVIESWEAEPRDLEILAQWLAGK